jgi:hypothetical protein
MGLTASNVNKKSAWQFVTFGSGGIGVAFVVGGGGQVVLADPSGINYTFTYGGIGVGLSAGLKIPKLGKIQIPTPKGPATGAVGPMAFPSTGTVFCDGSLPGGDLTKSDIQGLCMFAEVGGGLIAGASGTSLFVGLNPLLLPTLSIPGVSQLFINSARGMILMAGANVGIQAQIGASVSLGYLN